MPINPPNLDDRDFDQMLAEAVARIQTSCPSWTDLSVSDPGITLLEAFVYATDILRYSVNRVPRNSYMAFLKLMGVRLEPPSAASVVLQFSLSQPAMQAVEITRGTRVTTARTDAGTEPVVFATARQAVIAPGQTTASVLAHHCELVMAEPAGIATGQAAFSLKAARPPIVAPTGEDLDLMVGVEARPEELDVRAPAIEYGGKAYRIWREVENFTEIGADRLVYVADRLSGQISFAPAARMTSEEPGAPLQPARALAAVPTAGREIRLWYRRGGGAAGNVEAKTLTVLKNPIAGLQVTNPEPATGGNDAETLANALIRGPQELRAPWRAVTARDYEVLATSFKAVARAKAFTQSILWAHAARGTVEVLLVPAIPNEDRPGGKITLPQLLSRQTGEALARIQEILEERRPLGARCVAGWARYKAVRVEARVVAREEEDLAAVRDNVLRRLYEFMSPLPTPLQPAGWTFGRAVRVSNVYDAALSQPGVSYIDRVRLSVDDVPEADVASIRSDPFQPNTWYAAAGTKLFRSVDDGEGWEVVGAFGKGIVRSVRPHPAVAGLVAVTARVEGDQPGVALYVSRDCGETWMRERMLAFDVEDMAWIQRGSTPVLLLATSAGLYELALHPDATPAQIVVFPGDQEHGFYAVAAVTDIRDGSVQVAVASQAKGGVYLSSAGGRANTFRLIGLKEKDVRVLAVQQEGLRAFLWAGSAAASPADDGPGCDSWELLGAANPPEGWIPFNQQWTGGSCRSLAFHDGAIVAGTHHAGVLRLPARRAGAGWEPCPLDSGLPLRQAERLFHPVNTVASNPAGNLILVGSPRGVFCGHGEGPDDRLSYAGCSNRTFLDKVTLPPTWLLCSGDHSITVVSEDDA